MAPDAVSPLSPATVRTEVADGVGSLVMARAARSNALDAPTAEALDAAFERLAHDPSVRCVLLRAEGRRFGVGGDLDAFDVSSPETSTASVERLLQPLHRLMRRLRSCPLPVVAAVGGVAAGGSLSLALACDVGVWAAGTRLVPAYAALGCPPDCGLTWTLARALGPQRAIEWLLDGSAMTAEEARDAGLLRHVVPPEELLPRAFEMARQLATLAPTAVFATKRLVHDATARSWAVQLDAEQDAFTAAAATPAFLARVRAARSASSARSA